MQRRQILPVSIAVGVAVGTALAPALMPPPLAAPARLRARLAIKRPLPPVEVPVPPEEPQKLVDMSFDEARAFNATVPFSDERIIPARPFRYAGTPEDKARAETCLTAAVLYEAGDNRTMQQSVAQVVLNRVRHPSYPKTVCGVVFQGSERKTGCQFTFTCDGALARRWPEAAWTRARKVAAAALDGFVFGKVGTATHYHTDYVVPYWQPTLTKLSAVGTHLFFRFPGWQSPAKLNGRLATGEPLPKVLGGNDADPFATEEAAADLAVMEALTGSMPVTGVPQAALKGSAVRLKDEAKGRFIVQIDPASSTESHAALGLALCGGRAECLVMAWTKAEEIPATIPPPSGALGTLAFVYRKNPGSSAPELLWDCTRFPRRDRNQCWR